ncbi:Choline/carnitine acyltransferase domain [Sergentomyia squamirostris]
MPSTCAICKLKTYRQVDEILCGFCHKLYHEKCLEKNEKELEKYRILTPTRKKAWSCDACTKKDRDAGNTLNAEELFHLPELTGERVRENPPETRCRGRKFEAKTEVYSTFVWHFVDAEGWRDSLLSLPKKWLSTTEATDEHGFPEDLPKVPVPPLEQTMAEYLRLLEPILTVQHHERVRAIVKQFTAPTGLGPILQEYLNEKREAEANWVSAVNR